MKDAKLMKKSFQGFSDNPYARVKRRESPKVFFMGFVPFASFVS